MTYLKVHKSNKLHLLLHKQVFPSELKYPLNISLLAFFFF